MHMYTRQYTYKHRPLHKLTLNIAMVNEISRERVLERRMRGKLVKGERGMRYRGMNRESEGQYCSALFAAVWFHHHGNVVWDMT